MMNNQHDAREQFANRLKNEHDNTQAAIKLIALAMVFVLLTPLLLVERAIKAACKFISSCTQSALRFM